MFCDRFWNSKSVEDHISLGARPSSAIGDLATKEHIMIHEWFHNSNIDIGNFHGKSFPSVVSVDDRALLI